MWLWQIFQWDHFCLVIQLHLFTIRKEMNMENAWVWNVIVTLLSFGVPFVALELY
jgi:hypothetical protein